MTNNSRTSEFGGSLADNQQGSASIMVILIVFTLMVFGVFALMSSYSEYKLSKKYGEWVKDYYILDAKAEAMVAKLEPGERLETIVEDPDSVSGQKLAIEVVNEGDGFKVLKWRQLQNAFELDLTEELWDGQ